MTTILGYAYDAAEHCTACTSERYPSACSWSRLTNTTHTHEVDANGIPACATDSEGNTIHPIFSTDAAPDSGSRCADCGETIQERPPYQGKPITLPVRFFIYDEDASDIVECSESDFEASHWQIEYERNTVYANGVAQICLTKSPKF